MVKLTKAAARRRLSEAINKCKMVFMSQHQGAMTVKDFEAIEKILNKCMDRLK